MTKTKEQTFVQDWTKLQSWAVTNKIPHSALVPVFQMDAQRLQQGHPMTESERYRAVSASAGRKTLLTPLPSAAPTPSNLIGNTQHNLWQVFTGLNPIGIVDNIVHTVKNTVEHPQTTFEALYTKKKFEHLGTKPTSSLLSWLPGVTDLAEASRGKAGLEELAMHPVSSLLDIIPVTKPLDLLLHGDVGQAIAGRLGVPLEQLQNMHGTPGAKALYKLAGTIPVPGKHEYMLGKDASGMPTFTPNTIGNAMRTFLRRNTLGSDAADLQYSALTINEEQTHVAQRLLAPLNDAMKKLTEVPMTSFVDGTQTTARQEVIKLLTESGRTYDSLLGDQKIPIDIREAIRLYQPVEAWIQEMAIATGKIVPLRMPDGRTEIYTQTIGATVQKRIDNLDAAQQDMADQTSRAMEFSNVSHAVDMQIDNTMVQLEDLRQAVWQHITATIPHDNEAVNNQLRSALNPETRWTRSGFREDRIRRLTKTEDHRFDDPRVRQLLGIPKDEPMYVRGEKSLTKSHANVITDVFKPGGLIDQMKVARANRDYIQFRELSNTVNRRLTGKYAMEMSITASPQLFDTMRAMTADLKKLSMRRVESEKDFRQAYDGITEKGKKESLTYKTKKYMALQKEFENYVWGHPPGAKGVHAPGAYQPLFLRIYAQKLAEHENSPAFLDSVEQELLNKGFVKTELEAMRSNPQRLFEMVQLFAHATFDDPFVGESLPAIREEAISSALKEVRTLRAQGFIPHYVPTITPHEMKASGFDNYSVFIKSDRVPTPSQVFNRTWDMGSTVHNFMASVTHAVKDQLQHDGSLQFVMTHALEWAYKESDIKKMILNQPEFRDLLAKASNDEELGAIVSRVYKNELGLVEWDPDALFGVKLPRPSFSSGEKLLMPADMAHIISQITDREQFPLEGFWNKATNTFRFSILGLSPRYTAHILFGGSYLVALRLRTPASLVRFMGDAYKAARTGVVPGTEELFPRMTQYGAPDIAYHHMSGRQAGKWVNEEWLTNKGIDPKYAKLATWLDAAVHANYTFTNFITHMQRALVYLDGASRIKGGVTHIIDENGNKIVNITSERAIHEGMKAANEVMGDVRRMAPFERHWLTRAFPFYSWTKHILKYVMTYPFDHPFRAQILSGLAESNSMNVSTGLPLRTQLLLFLGSPDKNGTVKADTVRALDPLRTMANYASMSGYLSSLNPIITTAFQHIDPNITFGTNTLYPTISYNDVFGVEQGNPAGSPLSTISAIIPQVQALTLALGLNAQYRYLKKNDPEAYTKMIYNSFDIPFFNIQTVNLHQIAAKAAIDRYQVAATKARKAFETGTFSQLKGYTSVPYPENTVYNITPAQLQAIYETSMTQTGLPPSETSTYVQSPSGL